MLKQTISKDSINIRERKIFGTLSFVSPVVPKDGNETAVLSTRPNAPQHRKEQISRAQKTHRKRQKEYMNALEEEVLRLRERESSLNEEAIYWKRCALAVIGSKQISVVENFQLGPGLFLWTVSNFNDPLSQLLSRPQPPVYSSTAVMSQLAARDTLPQTLLQNFLENIMPTLDITETTANGYAKHVIPIALSSEIVLSSFLAASASHMRLTKSKTWAIECLKYRVTAISGLREASQRRPDGALFLSALTAILGLMIEDMIACTREFSKLLNLAEFWTSKSQVYRDQPDGKAAARFLLDQMQMLKALVYPLYQFDWSLGFDVSGASGKTDQQSSLFDSPMKLYETFRSMEDATSLACQIYKMSSTTDPNNNTEQQQLSSQSTIALLNKLQSTVHNIPPFALSENSLVWVYYVAAGNSTQSHHREYFTSRLAALLDRLGHENANIVLANTHTS